MTEVQTAPWVSNSSCEIRKCGRCLSLWTDVRAERVFLKPVVFLPLILIDHVCGCVIFSVCIDCEWRQAWVMALRLYAAHACVFTNTHKQHVSPGVCQQHSISSGFNTSLLACVLARVILCVSACGVVWGDEPSPLTTLHKNTFCSPWTLQMPPHCSSLLAPRRCFFNFSHSCLQRRRWAFTQPQRILKNQTFSFSSFSFHPDKTGPCSHPRLVCS